MYGIDPRLDGKFSGNPVSEHHIFIVTQTQNGQIAYEKIFTKCYESVLD